MKSLRIALACGGTGGHIFPGLATAEVLRERGHVIELFLAGKDIEVDAVKNWEGIKHVVRAQGFYRKTPVHVAKTIRVLQKARNRCRGIMRESRPDVLLAMGSYASVGPVKAAYALDVPVVLHEANVYPGRAVRHLSRHATAVAACFEETRHYLQKVQLAVTGMPLRQDLWRAAQAFVSEPEPFTAKPFTVLITGGSRGASPLNQLTTGALVELARWRRDFHVIHLTGRNDEAEVRRLYEKHNISHQVEAFVSDMVPLYTSADLAISRSGASTCAELCAFGLPALLVPYPYAVSDHQTANAQAMERIGVSDFVPESDLEAPWLAEYIDGCMHSPHRLERMFDAAMRHNRDCAASKLADLVTDVALGRQSIIRPTQPPLQAEAV